MLPDFCRLNWASAAARAAWEPRIRAASAAWLGVELASVAAGLRPSALQTVPADGLAAFRAAIAGRGLAAVPLAEVAPAAGYAAAAAPGRGAWRVAVTGPLREAEWRRAWAAGDDDAIGRLLGFPACCRAFFARTWGAGSVDGTLQMAGDGQGPAACNILGRWLGVRLVPHLPCGFRCAETEALAARLRPLWPAPVLAAAEAVLGWRCEYSALHGIAEIVWPVVKAVVRTDYTPRRAGFRRQGAAPPETPAGLRFPFAAPPLVQVTRGRSFAASLDAADPRTWQDNGFASFAAMEAAHAVVVRAAVPATRVLDLGSGNGRLARRLSASAQGVEADPDRAARAVVPTTVGRIEHYPLNPGAWDLVALMPGRLLEMHEPDARALLARLRAATPRILAYAYGDWLDAPGGMRALLDRAGLLAGAEAEAVESGAGVVAARLAWREP